MVQVLFNRWVFVSDGYIYLGKQVKTEGLGVGESVVLHLTEALKDSHARVYADNFFSSPVLAKKLLDNGIYFVGTVRSNRKGMPRTLKVSSACLNEKLRSRQASHLWT